MFHQRAIVQINKNQRRALLRAKELRDKPFPVIGSLLRSWKIYFLFALILCGYAWVAWSMGVRELSVAALGFLIGLVGRDITWFRVHAKMWPVNKEITDWAKVDQLLEQKSET
jgi:hypothetical protein